MEGLDSALSIRVDNFAAMVRACGVANAHAVARQVGAFAKSICGQGAVVRGVGGGKLQVRWERGARERHFCRDAAHRKTYAQELLWSFSCWARDTGNPARVSLWWEPLETSAAFGGSAQALTEAADLQLAHDVYGAVEAGRLMMFWQPVCSIEDRGLVLYRECLARVRSAAGGGVLFPGQFIPALERVGLMRCLDRHLVRCALEVLQAHPALELGVNISGQSAVCDVWWQATLAQMAQHPDAARRLVVEITETARLVAGEGRRFCARIQALGCRVAVDDFGAGFGVETSIEVRHPDVIKIDGSILRLAVQEQNVRRLAGMVGIAQDQAPVVVVEGVESQHDIEFVRMAGGLWVQGHNIGEPSLARAMSGMVSQNEPARMI